MQAAAAVSLQAAVGRPVLPSRPARRQRAVSVRASAKDEQEQVRGPAARGWAPPARLHPPPDAAWLGGAPIGAAA